MRLKPFASDVSVRKRRLDLRQILLRQALAELKRCDVLRQILLPLGACVRDQGAVLFGLHASVHASMQAQPCI